MFQDYSLPPPYQYSFFEAGPTLRSHLSPRKYEELCLMSIDSNSCLLTFDSSVTYMPILLKLSYEKDHLTSKNTL